MRRISQLDTMKIERKDERDNGRKSFFFSYKSSIKNYLPDKREERREKKYMESKVKMLQQEARAKL